MHHLKFVLALCAAVALLSGVVLGVDVGTQPVPRSTDPSAVWGIISAIDLEKGSVTVVPPAPAPAGTMPTPAFSFFINAQTKIIKNGQIAALKDLAIGDMCKAEIKYSFDRVPFALTVQASSPEAPPPALKSVSGVISAIDPVALKFELTGKSGPDGTAPVLKFFADKETKIIKNGQPVGFGDLKVGDAARVGFVPSSTSSPGSVIRAAVIEAKSPVTPPPANIILEGLITGINLDKGSIRLESPTRAKPPVTFFVVDSTKIMRNGQPALLKDLKVGDACRAEVKPTPDGTLVALNVQVKSAATPPPGLKTVAGTISAIDYSKLTFELTAKPNPMAAAVNVLKFFADKETKIRKNGNPAGFGDLKVGDMAGVGFVPGPTLQPGSTIRAAVIEVKNPETPPPGNIILEGLISAINLDRGSITLASPKQDKPPVTFFVVDSTKIMRNGQPALLKDLKVGDACRAEVKPTPDGTLVALNVQTKSAATPPPGLKTVAGVISAIDYSALTFTLFIKGENNLQPGSLIVLTNTNTKIRKNGQPIGFGDLKVGDWAGVGFVPDTPLGPGSTIRAVVIEAKTPPLGPR